MQSTVILRGFKTQPTAFKHTDVNETIVLSVLDQSQTQPIQLLLAYDKTGTIRELGRASVGGKDNSGSAIVYADGTVIHFVSEAELPGGDGKTSVIRAYKYPQILPPSVSNGTNNTVIDAVARSTANSALGNANSAYTAANNALTIANGAKTAANAAYNLASQSHVTVQEATDIAWTKAGDRIYAELQNANSPLMTVMWQKIKDGAYALLKELKLI